MGRVYHRQPGVPTVDLGFPAVKLGPPQKRHGDIQVIGYKVFNLFFEPRTDNPLRKVSFSRLQ